MLMANTPRLSAIADAFEADAALLAGFFDAGASQTFQKRSVSSAAALHTVVPSGDIVV